MNKGGRLLGIDYGMKRVGVALSDESGIMAFPKAVIPNDRYLFTEIKNICEANHVTAIVMGESKDFDMKENKIMKRIHAFKSELERDLGLPVYLEPEFMTTTEAQHLQGKTSFNDASAAALILKSYIEKQK